MARAEGGEDRVEGLRGSIIGEAGGRWEGVLDRYTMVAARSSAEATILDTESGREVTVGLCDLNGAIAALKAFG